MFLSPRYFKKASGILQLPPYVRLPVRLSVTLSPPKLLGEGCATWGPVEGPKGQILLNIIKFQLHSQFQRFLNQTLCVFSQ